jgi:hypothetical protein
VRASSKAFIEAQVLYLVVFDSSKVGDKVEI